MGQSPTLQAIHLEDSVAATQRRELSEEKRFVISCKYNSYKPFCPVLFVRLLNYKMVRLLHLEVHCPKITTFNISGAFCKAGKVFDTAMRTAQNVINTLLGLNLYTNSCERHL